MSATSDYLSVCEQAARAGGAILLEKIGRVEVREKAPADLVTEADLASQERISQIILDRFPDHCLLGEENLQTTGLEPKADQFRWIVDPLDGTTNYVHGVPHFSVSLALERRGKLLAGVVYNPVAEECFTAVAGGGAWLSGKPIHTSDVSTPSKALAAIGFPPTPNRESPDVKAFLAAAERCQALRRTGSAALNLCYVAAGRFDATWSFSTRIWDMAAGVLIVREAGGVVTSPTEGDLALEIGHFLASANQRLHAEIQAMLIQAVE